MKTKNKGFTLIELLIVIAIIGILAGIAIPMYRDQVTKTRRVDGQAALLDLAARMERYYAENQTYATATVGTGNATTDVISTSQTPDGYYTLSILNQNAGAFTVQAAPTGAQATADTKCASLRIDQLGQKTITGTGTTTACW